MQSADYSGDSEKQFQERPHEVDAGLGPNIFGNEQSRAMRHSGCSCRWVICTIFIRIAIFRTLLENSRIQILVASNLEFLRDSKLKFAFSVTFDVSWR